MFLDSISAEEILRPLGGHKVHGRCWARCPAHWDIRSSLLIGTGGAGEVVACCYAGCPQHAVIEALRSRLWGSAEPANWRLVRHLDQHHAVGADLGKRTEAAFAIWRRAESAAGSVLERYLAHRGITCKLPKTLRVLPELKHPSGDIYSAMIALVTRGSDDAPIGIHGMYLCDEPDPRKMMLGRCRGGAVRLGEPGELLVVSEGIGTGLSLMQATGLPVWAALSTWGLRSLELPRSVTAVIVVADGNDPGEAAAVAAAQRWKAERKRVLIARPLRAPVCNHVLTDDDLPF
jgi:putative DNA primase/helicase